MKHLVIFTAFFLVLLGCAMLLFAHDLTSQAYELNIDLFFYQASFSPSISALIFVPLCLYAIFALLIVYLRNIGARIHAHRIDKDAKNFEKFCANKLLQKDAKYSFKSAEFAQIEPVVNQLISALPAASGGLVAEALGIKNQILAGEYVSPNGGARLDKKSALSDKNYQNLCAKDLAEAKNCLKNKTALSNPAEFAAYENLLANGDYADIKTLKIPRENADVMLILQRASEAQITLSAAEIEVLLSASELQSDEFITAAKWLKALLEPAQLLAIFSKLAAAKDAAVRAHFYLLASFGMFDELREKVAASESAQEDFELLIFLKDHAKAYDIDKLIG